jgi:hypothetical protein
VLAGCATCYPDWFVRIDIRQSSNIYCAVNIVDPRRHPGVAAVGLAGVAPRLVPSCGHAALIPDASGLYFVPGLRAALAFRDFVEGGLGGLAVSF